MPLIPQPLPDVPVNLILTFHNPSPFLADVCGRLYVWSPFIDRFLLAMI